LRSSSSEPPVDTYVPEQQDTSRGLFDQNAQYELRQQRIDDAHGAAPTIVIGDSVLHSGAPRTSQTGPETVIALVLMTLAGLCTFAVAHAGTRVLATV
jgi:hypothetical protein